MARISMLTPDQLDPELRRRSKADERTPLELGLTRIFGHQPAMAAGLGAFGAALKVNRTLPERLIELVRLRVAFHNQCRSCMAMRYADAVDAGVTEDLVCSLERPHEAPDLTAPERLALSYADLMATNHLAINDAFYTELKEHFSEKEIVEIGSWCAICVGFGRLSATWDMTEDLPERFQDTDKPVTPWGPDAWVTGAAKAAA